MNQLKKILKKSTFLSGLVKAQKTKSKKKKYAEYYNDMAASKGRLSYNDEMFSGDIKHYLGAGESAISNIKESLEMAGTDFGSINHILDLPCGHGRVMRHMIEYIPASKITGCEIDPDAVKFCQKEFGCVPLISNLDYKKIKFPFKYDLIWVGSLFTHLDKKNFRDLLEVLYDNLNAKGVLVFTAHGDHSLSLMDLYISDHSDSNDKIKKIYDNEGFYYTPYDGNPHYGISLSRKDIVCKWAEEISKGNLELLRFKFRGWDNHQDVYTFIKK